MNFPFALITGASGGIGRDISLELARIGYPVILVARNLKSLDTIRKEIQKMGGTAHCLAADLSQAKAVDRIYTYCRKSNFIVGILVNNAGVGMGGSFATAEAAVQDAMLQLNVVALTRLTRLFLPDMLDRHSGKILNVGSVAGYMPGPYMAAYYASKAYVHSFTLALREELQGSGVSVTLLAPGATRTDFFQRAGILDSSVASGGFFPVLSSRNVAKFAVSAMLKGKREAIPGFLNRVTPLVVKLLPGWLIVKITARLNRNR